MAAALTQMIPFPLDPRKLLSRETHRLNTARFSVARPVGLILRDISTQQLHFNVVRAREGTYPMLLEPVTVQNRAAKKREAAKLAAEMVATLQKEGTHCAFCAEKPNESNVKWFVGLEYEGMPVVFGDFVPLCGNTECRTKLKEMKRMFSEYLTLRFGYPFPIAEISVSGQLLQQHRWVVNYVQLDKKGNLGIASGAMPVSFLRPREIQPPPVGFWGACLGCAMNPRVEEERTRNMDLLSKLFVSSKSPVMFVVPNFEADVVFNYVSATHCSSPHCNKAAKDAMVSFLTVSMKKWKSEDDAWVNHKQCDYDLCKTLAPARFLKRCANCKIGFYCGLHCQRQHWGTHKTECNL